MGLLDKLREIIGGKKEDVSPIASENNELNLMDTQGELEIDEEDKLVVALAASIMAGKDKNNSYYHITKIRRIK
ncbi:hypothetical protein ACPWSR_10260 [Alloiococcus sp. CFN-8]|uniref:hypothetical protein n=1 Tax=Alloiococcus sp. CFN-8 TaxID=3416081 RepID=UPI003CEEDF7D